MAEKQMENRIARESEKEELSNMSINFCKVNRIEQKERLTNSTGKVNYTPFRS